MNERIHQSADDDDELPAGVADPGAASMGSRVTVSETSAARLEEVVAEYDDLLGSGDSINVDQRIKSLRARTETLMHLAKLRGEDRLSFRQFLASSSWKKIEGHIEWLLGKVDASTVAEFRARMLAEDEAAKGVLKDAP